MQRVLARVRVWLVKSNLFYYCFFNLVVCFLWKSYLLTTLQWTAGGHKGLPDTTHGFEKLPSLFLFPSFSLSLPSAIFLLVKFRQAYVKDFHEKQGAKRNKRSKAFLRFFFLKWSWLTRSRPERSSPAALCLSFECHVFFFFLAVFLCFFFCILLFFLFAETGEGKVDINASELGLTFAEVGKVTPILRFSFFSGSSSLFCFLLRHRK